MGAVAKIFSPLVSILVLMGMFTGLYNPRMEAFVPGKAAVQEADIEKMALIEDGASEYGIVVGENAIPAERTAAEKLQGFLKQISGVELPIASGGGAFEKKIVIGIEEGLDAEGFAIRTQGGDIAIMGGGPRGVLYGVYEFLQKFLGCRWYSGDIVVIPESDTVMVPQEIDLSEQPAFIYRNPTTVRRLTTEDVDYCLANKVNGVQAVEDERYGGMVRYPIYHAGEEIMPTSEYFDEKPYLYAQREDGQPFGGYTNPCLTEPEVLEIYVSYALERLAEEPDLLCMSMGLNDSGDVCQCRRCRDVYAVENGSVSGTYIRFLNAVCERLVEAGYPDVKVSGFGYAVTEVAPVTKAHENVVIFFCAIGMCYVHRAGECTQEETRLTFDVQFRGWADVCGHIAIYDYPLTYDHYGIPYPIWNAQASYIKFYSENNVFGLLNCSNCTDDVNFYVMTGWLCGKLLWNPDADLDALYEEFLPLYYGEGWRYIREYIRLTSDELTGQTIGGVEQHTRCQKGSTTLGNLVVTNNQAKYIDALWAKAKERTGAAGQEAQLTNIRRAEVSWRVWKADNFRGEFRVFRIPGTRMKSNAQLFEDIWALGVTQHDEGCGYVSLDDFNELGLKVLGPKYWSWRQIGRDYEGKIHNVWQMLRALVS